MTVHQRNEESREPSFPEVSPCCKNNWPKMENDSSSWDPNSRATSPSWPGDTEDAATRRVLQLWYAIERNLFDELDEWESLQPVSDECNQWRTQLTHLRVVGKCLTSGLPQDGINESLRSASRRSRVEDRSGEEIIMEDSRDGSKPQDLNGTSRYPGRAEDQSEVFDRIFVFVYSELSKYAEKREADSLGRTLDGILRITPAPTYSNRKMTKSSKKRELGASRKSSANESRTERAAESTVDISREADRTISATSRRPAKNSTEDDGAAEVEEPDLPQVARNKLGTVFNEKIVVSPVPFVVSQRESFTTLRTTPISFRAQTFKISAPQGSGRYRNSDSETVSGQRMSGFRISQSHSAWQAPVCPTVWPKNIRLAPIDPSRLPSSKNRSSSDLPALPQKNRNSLSPISHPSKPVPSASLRDHSCEGLEIQGKQIATRSPKQNHPKIGSPRNAKSTRTKVRAQKR